jgi:hypothetical protein
MEEWDSYIAIAVEWIGSLTDPKLLVDRSDRGSCYCFFRRSVNVIDASKIRA